VLGYVLSRFIASSLELTLFLHQLVFGARIKAYHVWQSAESSLKKTKSAHEKAKKSGRTHSELLGLSVSEIAEVSIGRLLSR
jgi:hypothetical protein